MSHLEKRRRLLIQPTNLNDTTARIEYLNCKVLSIDGGEVGEADLTVGEQFPLSLASNAPSLLFNVVPNDTGTGYEYGPGSAASSGGSLVFNPSSGQFLLNTALVTGNAGAAATMVTRATFGPGGNAKVEGNLGVAGAGTTYPLNIAGSGGATTAQLGSTLPLYYIADHPGVGYNMYFSGGSFRFGAGSSGHYGAFMGFNPTNGDFNLSETTGSGTAGGSTGTVNRLSLVRSGAALCKIAGSTGTAVCQFGTNLPVYVGSEWPWLAFNARLSSGTWYFGDASSSNHAGLFTLDANTGDLEVYQSTAAGNAGGVASMQKTLDVQQSGNVDVPLGILTTETYSHATTYVGGCMSAPASVTLKLTRAGRTIQCFIPTVVDVGGSSASAIAINDVLPSDYRPSVDQFFPLRVLRSGTDEIGVLTVYTTGALDIRGAGYTTFPSGGGAKIVFDTCVSWWRD